MSDQQTADDVKLLLDFANGVCPKLRDVLEPYGADPNGWNEVAERFRVIAEELPRLRAQSRCHRCGEVGKMTCWACGRKQ